MINKRIGYLTMRLLTGLIFFMQGYGKVFKMGVENVYNAPFFKGTYENLLPSVITHFTAYYTSYVELLAGFMIIIGLKTNYALYALASVLVIVTFGHGLAEPIWDLSHVMFRAILLIGLLFLPQEWNICSIDQLLMQGRKIKSRRIK